MSRSNYVLTAGLIHLCKATGPGAGEQFRGTSKLFSQSRSAFARGSHSGRLDFSPEARVISCGRVVWFVVEQSHGHQSARNFRSGPDARPSDRALMDAFFLRELSSDQTAIVVRAIAQGIAEGRKEGLELAKCQHD